ncbi:hypothetical protein DL546_005817 [Coniochaeta pulveracea]|uniref:Uncharacterized protein n=1 Tax=Coniochaeta pulveracea TaxID=177199 RepID=A0A420Y3H9_9PEZI|nr:hypothetical protein DL546_005817 [Coniochaeta pulveracea]
MGRLLLLTRLGPRLYSTVATAKYVASWGVKTRVFSASRLGSTKICVWTPLMKIQRSTYVGVAEKECLALPLDSTRKTNFGTRDLALLMVQAIGKGLKSRCMVIDTATNLG